jgi:nucleosome binding factor SPN SPT16 subunit
MKTEGTMVAISDTVVIGEDGGAKRVWKSSMKYKDISYSIQEETQEEQEIVRESRLRENNVRGRGEDERKQHQDEIYVKKLQELKERYERGGLADVGGRHKVKKLDEVWSYKGEHEFPKDLFKNHIYVDFKRDSLLIPIVKGVMVPVHVSIVKNVSITNEGKWSHLRLNFHTPSSGNSNATSNLVFPPLPGKNRIYMKEMTFKSGDGKSLPTIFKMIKDLQKKYKQKNQTETNMKGLKKQDELMKLVGGKHQLENLTVRPNISGKKTVGKLELHKNGLRFISSKSQELILVFNNIKHAIFQPWDDELIVLLHLHLNNEIIVGNKRTKDVQFLTEAGSQFDDLDQRYKKKMSDIDELEQEQREINLKKRLNQRFLNFVQKVEEISKSSDDPFQFDVPYKELSFYGNTGRSIVKLMPTVNWIVNLTEFPFFLTTIDEIEHIHFERVMVSI